MELNDIVKNFEEIVKKHGEYLDKGKSNKANKFFNKAKAEYEKLKDRGAIESLEPLMNSENPYVRLEASVLLLQVEKFQETAKKVLRQLKENEGICSLEAEICLGKWERGVADWF